MQSHMVTSSNRSLNVMTQTACLSEFSYLPTHTKTRSSIVFSTSCLNYVFSFFLIESGLKIANLVNLSFNVNFGFKGAWSSSSECSWLLSLSCTVPVSSELYEDWLVCEVFPVCDAALLSLLYEPLSLPLSSLSLPVTCESTVSVVPLIPWSTKRLYYFYLVLFFLNYSCLNAFWTCSWSSYLTERNMLAISKAWSWI